MAAMKPPVSRFLIVAIAAAYGLAANALPLPCLADDKPVVQAGSAVPTDIDNFERVSPTLFRGAAPDDREDIDALKKMGVTTILSLQMHRHRWEERAARQAGIEFVRIPLGYLAPSADHVAAMLKIISDPSRRVFVHCRQGADRTGMLVAMYRIMKEHWTFDEAYGEMRAHHFKPWLFALKERVETCSSDTASSSDD